VLEPLNVISKAVYVPVEDNITSPLTRTEVPAELTTAQELPVKSSFLKYDPLDKVNCAEPPVIKILGALAAVPPVLPAITVAVAT